MINHKLIITILFYLLPFADFLTGFLVLNKYITEGGLASPSQILRLVTVTLIFYYNKRSNKHLLPSITLLSYFIFIEFYSYFFHLDIFGLAIGLVFCTKLIYIISIYNFFLLLNKEGKINYEILLSHIKNAVIITAVLLLIPYSLGFGYATYEGSDSSKGYFASGNALGAYIGSGILLFSKNSIKSNNIVSIIVLFGVLFSCILVGTKTAFIFMFIFIAIFFIQLRTTAKLSFIIFFTFLFGYISTIVLDRFDVFFSRIDFTNLIGFIFSERDNFVIDAFRNFSLDGVYFLRIFIGFGAYLSYRNPEFIEYPFVDILESDIADIFFMYGISILILYFYSFYNFTRYAFKARNFILLTNLILLFTASSLAGHVVFNGMSGQLLSCLCALSYMCYNESEYVYIRKI
jgi:hypothetical protein